MIAGFGTVPETDDGPASGGRITVIEIGPIAILGDSIKDIWIRAIWDDDSHSAIDVPAADFFGCAFGHPSMKSILLGSDGERGYCYFPMPFDRGARVELYYKGTGIPVHLTVGVQYNFKKRNPFTEGKFYAHWVSKDLSPTDPYHEFLHTTGRGQLVGTVLVAEGQHKPGTPFFEGDDSTATDGVFRIHGTGSEDYFNGGWYALPARWDTARSFPLSGCLVYSERLSRSGGYRL